MAHVSKTELVNELKRTINTNASRKGSFEEGYINLVDTAVVTNHPVITFDGLTTSGSKDLNLEVIQPANTILTGIDVLCGADTDLGGTGTIGVKVGTAVGGTELAAVSHIAFNGAGGVVKKGQMCSTVAKTATAQSGSELTLTAMTSAGVAATMTTTERTIHVQISASRAFNTNTGAFKPVITFERL